MSFQKKTQQEQQLSYVEEQPIQVFLGCYYVIKHFKTFERFLAKIKPEIRFFIQQKIKIVDLYDVAEIIISRKLNLDPDQPIEENNPFVNKYRYFQHICIFNQLTIKAMYIYYLTTNQTQQLISKNINTQDTSWSIKLHIEGQIRGKPIQLQLTYEVPKDKINQSDAQIQRDALKKLKEQIQLVYKEGNWEQLYKLATYVDFRLELGGSFIQNFTQKVSFQPDLIYESVSIFSDKSILEVETLFFLSESVYMQQIILSNVTVILRDRQLITRRIIEKHSKWIDFIIQPKYDGIRALLVSRKGVVLLLFESYIEILAQGIEIPTLVMEVEVYKNNIYINDLHYNEQSVITQHQLARLYIASSILPIIQKTLHNKQPYNIQLNQFILITKEIGNDQTKLESVFKQIIQQPVPSFGIILTTNQSYYSQSVFKWRPITKLSIDFFCQIISPKLLDQPDDPEFLYIGLFCQITNKDFETLNVQYLIEPNFECQHKLIIFQSPKLNKPAFLKRSIKEETETPLNNKVAEFNFNTKSSTWEFFRLRPDKDPQQMNFGDYFLTSIAQLNGIIEFIPFESLYTSEVKFFREKLLIYENIFKFIDQTKLILLNNIQEKNNLENALVLSSGIGYDLDGLISNNFQKIVCLDQEEINIEQTSKYFQQLMKTINNPVLMYTKILDFNDKQSTNVLIDIAQEYDIQFITCTRFVEELVLNNKIFDQFFKSISNNGKKKKTIVQFIFLNGRKLFDLLQKNDDIQLFEQKMLKYQYQRTYNVSQLLDVGLHILIKPYSRNSLIEQKIFNPDYLVHLMQRNGFECTFKFDFSGEIIHGNLYTQDQLQLIQLQFRALSQQDQFHASLYSVYIFETQN